MNASSPAAVSVHRFAHGGDGDRRRAVWPALALAVFEVVGTIGASQGQPEARDLDVLAFVLVLAAPVALVWRRSHPQVALGVALASAVTYLALDYPKGPIFIGLALSYANAVVMGWRRLALATLVVGYVVVAWVMPAFEDGPWPDWSLVAGLGAWLLVLAVASELIRSRLDQRRELIRLEEQRAAARAEEARRRASEERLRIARELHDVLAHNISLINVRAGVALHLVDERPDGVEADQVRPALAAIKDASKEALGELRSVLDLLRQGEAAPLAPTAGLADLDRLAEGTRGTGLDVLVERVDGEGRAVSQGEIAQGLPAGVGLAAYRIVQEALTNVVRHADASRVTVRLRRTPDALEVRVDDDGVGATAPLGPPTDGAGGEDGVGATAPLGPPTEGAGGEDGGRGLAGMRERALALGGTAEAGPRPGRGFRVRARFPLAGGGA